MEHLAIDSGYGANVSKKEAGQCLLNSLKGQIQHIGFVKGKTNPVYLKYWQAYLEIKRNQQA